jgi:hypothetical protein
MRCRFEEKILDGIFADGILQIAFLQTAFCRWILQMASAR